MKYQGAQEARKQMKVPCEIIRVPQVCICLFVFLSLHDIFLSTHKIHLLINMQAGHFVFIDNPSGFHAALFYACRRFLSPDPDHEPLPEGLTSA